MWPGRPVVRLFDFPNRHGAADLVTSQQQGMACRALRRGYKGQAFRRNVAIGHVAGVLQPLHKHRSCWVAHVVYQDGAGALQCHEGISLAANLADHHTLWLGAFVVQATNHLAFAQQSRG